MPTLIIDTNALVKFTNDLEKLHKSALPSAIRGALNDAAFDLKTKTMPSKAQATFKQRDHNFFKANSKFQNATGFDIGTMKSIVGFVESGLKGENNYAVKDLEQQESGGTIDKKSFIPLDPARTGKGSDRPVRPNARLKSINKIVNARNQQARSKKEQFVKATLKAGVGGFVLGSSKKGENILWRVDSLTSNVSRKEFTPKLTPLYDWAKGRNIKVKRTGFMQSASLQTEKSMDYFYQKQAERQIAKFSHH